MGEHAIIVIKNEKNEYLQYYDKIWQSFLFLNCKLPNGNDTEIVKDKLFNEFNIEKEMIKVSYIGKKEHIKFSESAKTEKKYIHYFYNVKIDTDLIENMIKLNSDKYKWFSYSDLLNDKRIQKVNGDIVGFIKEFNM